MDDGAREVQLDRFRDSGPRVGDGDLRTGSATKLLRDLVDLPALRRDAIDRDDAVAFLDACLVGGRVRKDASHDDTDARLLLEQHARAAITAVGAPIERVALLRREQLAVRIVELAHHAPRRLLEDLVVLERIDVARLDQRAHLIEEVSTRARRGLLEEKATGNDRNQEQRRDRRCSHSGHRFSGGGVENGAVGAKETQEFGLQRQCEIARAASTGDDCGPAAHARRRLRPAS